MDETASRRERRAAAQRSRILAAAARVFAEKGFYQATIRDLAQAADVADGTIYNYFENKDALLLALIEQLGEAEQAPLIAAQGELGEAVLERMQRLRPQYDQIIAVLPVILGTPELRAQYYQRFVVPVAAALERDIASRQPASEDSAAATTLTARMLVATVLGFQMLMILNDPLVHAAWEQPELLSKIWARFIASGIHVLTHDQAGGNT